MDVCLRRALRILVLISCTALAACAAYNPRSGDKYNSVLDMSKDVARQFSPTIQTVLLKRGRNFSVFEDEHVRGAAFQVQAGRPDKLNIEMNFREYCSRHEGLLYSRKSERTGLFEYRCEPYLGGVLFSVITKSTDYSQQTGLACLSFMVLEQKDSHTHLQADLYMESGSPSKQVLTALSGC